MPLAGGVLQQASLALEAPEPDRGRGGVLAVEEQLGVPLFPPNEELPEDVEVELSRLVAEGAQQVLQANKSQQAQQQAQDPLVQLQMEELKIKQAEQQRKVAKDKADTAIKAEQLQVERARIAAQQSGEDKRVRMDALKAANTTISDRQRLMAELSVDVLRHLSDKSHANMDRAQQDRQHARQMQVQAMSKQSAGNKPKGE